MSQVYKCQTEILGLKVKQRWPKQPVVKQWFGISTDEMGRMSLPRTNKTIKAGVDLFGTPIKKRVWKAIYWRLHYYPLIGAVGNYEGLVFDRDWKGSTRFDCIQWTRDNGYPDSPRSACIGCPYHSDEEWLRLKTESPDEFMEAVVFDALMRNAAGMRGELYLHRSCRPLGEIDFAAEIAKRQECPLVDLMTPGMVPVYQGVADGECEGMCGV